MFAEYFRGDGRSLGSGCEHCSDIGLCSISDVKVDTRKALNLLKSLVVTKSSGPDQISPLLFCKMRRELDNIAVCFVQEIIVRGNCS